MKIGKLYITWGQPPATVVQMDAEDLALAIDAQIRGKLKQRQLSPGTGVARRY